MLCQSPLKPAVPIANPLGTLGAQVYREKSENTIPLYPCEFEFGLELEPFVNLMGSVTQSSLFTGFELALLHELKQKPLTARYISSRKPKCRNATQRLQARQSRLSTFSNYVTETHQRPALTTYCTPKDVISMGQCHLNFVTRLCFSSVSHLNAFSITNQKLPLQHLGSETESPQLLGPSHPMIPSLLQVLCYENMLLINETWHGVHCQSMVCLPLQKIINKYIIYILYYI